MQGAGVHHNPAPGPAGAPYVYGHIGVVLTLLVPHPAWGVVALTLPARLFVPAKQPHRHPGQAPAAVARLRDRAA